MLTGSIPPTGLLLPFILAGGISRSVFMGEIEILCNVEKSEESRKEFEEYSVELKLFKKTKRM